MLAKCANPPCSASFRYLQEGMLFKLEAERGGTNSLRAEYFWLCSDCSNTMTLSLNPDAALKPFVIKKTSPVTPDKARSSPVNRAQGLLLRCIHVRQPALINVKAQGHSGAL